MKEKKTNKEKKSQKSESKNRGETSSAFPPSRMVGRPRKYNPETLSEIFDNYVIWISENPLKCEKILSDGATSQYNVRRPMSLQGFCVFAGILPSCFRRYEGNREEFGEVCERVRMTIEADQIEGAFANQYNPMISARILGLRDGADITTNGNDIAAGSGINAINVTYNGESFQLTSEDIMTDNDNARASRDISAK